jgi:hypothetical protein
MIVGLWKLLVLEKALHCIYKTIVMVKSELLESPADFKISSSPAVVNYILRPTSVKKYYWTYISDTWQNSFRSGSSHCTEYLWSTHRTTQDNTVGDINPCPVRVSNPRSQEIQRPIWNADLKFSNLETGPLHNYVPSSRLHRKSVLNIKSGQRWTPVCGMITGGVATLTNGRETYLTDIDQIFIQNLRHSDNYY